MRKPWIGLKRNCGPVNEEIEYAADYIVLYRKR